MACGTTNKVKGATHTCVCIRSVSGHSGKHKCGNCGVSW